MDGSSSHVVIIGAGHAGGSAAAYLRQYGFVGPITLIGDEAVAPYQRPPLSKAWLKGESDAEALLLKPEAFYAAHHIDLRLGVKATAIERSAKIVRLSSGEALAYDHLILATGARARPLPVPGADLDGVMALRNMTDAEGLKTRLGPGKRLAVVGAGYIGLEAAASARALGGEAVVIEVQPRVLARVACPVLSDFFEAYHRARGVAFALNVVVVGFEGEAGRVTGVRLNNGRVIACDVALVGIGAIPNDDLARDAGLDCADGVVVGLTAQTADPAVFAIGDVSRRPLPLYERQFRLESVANALEQAKQAASVIAGRQPAPPEVTWNWSDQYDLKLQIAGLALGADQTVVRGDPAAAQFAVFHLKAGRIQAVEAVNAAPEFMAGRQLIASQRPVSPDRLADITVSMKEVAG